MKYKYILGLLGALAIVAPASSALAVQPAQVTLTPQATGNSTYGIPMYNLTCAVSGFT